MSLTRRAFMSTLGLEEHGALSIPLIAARGREALAATEPRSPAIPRLPIWMRSVSAATRTPWDRDPRPSDLFVGRSIRPGFIR